MNYYLVSAIYNSLLEVFLHQQSVLAISMSQLQCHQNGKADGNLARRRNYARYTLKIYISCLVLAPPRYLTIDLSGGNTRFTYKGILSLNDCYGEKN